MAQLQEDKCIRPVRTCPLAHNKYGPRKRRIHEGHNLARSTGSERELSRLVNGLPGLGQPRGGGDFVGRHFGADIVA